MKKIRQHRCCFNNKPLTASDSCVQWRNPPQKTSGWTSTVIRLQLWRTRDSPRKKIWWISTDPTEDRSVKVRVTANSLNDLRQITQNLVCRGLVSSGNRDVVSTTKVDSTQMAASTKEIHLKNRSNWWILTKVDTSNFQRTGINSIRWFHCLNPTDKRSESHSINVCSQRRTGTSLQRKRPRNHLMEGQPILISAGS